MMYATWSISPSFSKEVPGLSNPSAAIRKKGKATCPPLLSSDIRPLHQPPPLRPILHPPKRLHHILRPRVHHRRMHGQPLVPHPRVLNDLHPHVQECGIAEDGAGRPDLVVDGDGGAREGRRAVDVRDIEGGGRVEPGEAAGEVPGEGPEAEEEAEAFGLRLPGDFEDGERRRLVGRDYEEFPSGVAVRLDPGREVREDQLDLCLECSWEMVQRGLEVGIVRGEEERSWFEEGIFLTPFRCGRGDGGRS